MNAPLLLPAAAATLCAAFLILFRHFISRPLALPPQQLYTEKTSVPATPNPCDVETGETPPPMYVSTPDYISDLKIGADIIDEVWPPVERETDEPAPTLGASLPDVALVWGVDYSFDARPPMAAVDRRPLMIYSHIASALGVDEPEPVVRTRSRSQSLSSSPTSASSATDTRPMRSQSLISGIVSDWNSLSQSEQQAWATLSEARAARSRSSQNSRTRQFDS